MRMNQFTFSHREASCDLAVAFKSAPATDALDADVVYRGD